MALVWIVGILILLSGLYLWLIAPDGDAPSVEAFEGWLYAHRGLHDEKSGVSENSLSAFQAAVDAGYGMELDVQLTRDKQLVVFHDGDLKRMCGTPARVRDVTYDELMEYPLPDGSVIPLFTEVLAMVAGQAPIIVEVKHHGGAVENAEATLRILQGYEGPYCVESFHPLAVRYFQKNAPDILRGQLAGGGKWNREELGLLSHFAMKHLLVNAVGRPHFVAYSCPEDHTLGMWLMKRFFHPPLAAWTIRDEATLKAARQNDQWPIFEGFKPDLRFPKK